MTACPVTAIELVFGSEDRGIAIPEVDSEFETNVPGLYVAGTASAGTQHSYSVFIENCHIHAERIAAALAGREPPPDPPPLSAPES